MSGQTIAEESQQPWWKGMTKPMWITLVVAWLGWVFDVMDTALFNFARPSMMETFFGKNAPPEITGPAEGKIQMFFIIGWAIGGFLFGILADRWGRAKTMTLTILLYCLLTGLTGLCQTIEQVILLRFLTGLGIGGEWAAGAALIAESVPNRARAGAAALLQTAAAFGPWLAALANFCLKDYSWRWLFLIGVLPAVLTVFIRMKVREPERFVEQKQSMKGNAFSGVKELFAHPKWRRHVIVAMIVGVVGIAGASNLSYWLPNLVKAASEGVSPEEIKARTSYVTLIMHVGTIGGVFVVPWLCNVWGRKRTLITFFVLCPASVLFALNSDFSYVRLLWMAPVMAFVTIGVTAAFGLYFPELFPTRLRATGAGTAYNTARILHAPLPWLTGIVIGMEKSSPQHGVVLAAGVYVIGLFAVFFAPETRGKPLPEE